MIHYSFIGYMLASAIVMIACVMSYRVLLENKVRPSVNRLILLSIYAISFLIPLFAAIIPDSQNEIVIETGSPEFAGVVGDLRTEEKGFDLELPEIIIWISRIYFPGLFLTFLLSVLTFSHLIILLKKSKTKEIAGTEVYVHGNKKLSSFSWGNKIFLYNESLNLGFNELQMLVSHEKAHLERGHWIDLTLAQIVLIFQWFNPATWFLRSELQRIHEYEVDEAVLRSGNDEKEYQMLLIQNISGNRYSGLTDGLNNCSLKKRIIMMKKTKFKKDWAARGIAVCGFALLGGFIIHIPAVADVLEDNTKSSVTSEKSIVINSKVPNEKSDAELEYNFNSLKIKKEEFASVDPAGIKETDKSAETPNVEITSKKDLDFDNLDKRDFSEFKKKGLVENYPDAYGVFDKIAEYKGGQSQLIRDISETMVYPKEAMEQNIQGKVVVRFQINTNGTISNCEVVYSQNPILNEAALQAVENLPGKWQPAEVEGKPVASVFNLPVTFRLQSSKENTK